MRDYRVKACETLECLVRLVLIRLAGGSKSEEKCGTAVTGRVEKLSESEKSLISDLTAARRREKKRG